jgi:membrane-associated phospholipid phosphatase
MLLPCFGSFSQNNDIELLRTFNIDRNQNFDSFFKVVTDSYAPIGVLTPATVFAVGLITNDTILKRKGLMIGGSLFISTVVMTSLKYGVRKDRPFVTYPDIERLVSAGSPSFPSGHTSVAFSTATSLSIAFPKWYVITPSFLWASAVGYSRMHLGVHYPSDVFVGALIGAGSAWLSNFLSKKISWDRNKASDLYK